MAEINLLAQIGAVAGGIIVGGGAAWKWINGRPKKITSNNKCPDIDCHDMVQEHDVVLKRLDDTIHEDIFPKINQTAEDVAYIRGKISVVLKTNDDG